MMVRHLVQQIPMRYDSFAAQYSEDFWASSFTTCEWWDRAAELENVSNYTRSCLRVFREGAINTGVLKVFRLQS